MTLLGVTIPARNEQDYIGETLGSLLTQSEGHGSLSPSDYEIVVVENNSDDNTTGVVEDVARRSAVRVTHLRRDASTAAAARTLGIDYLLSRSSPPRYLVSCDADTHYPPGWLPALARALDLGADLVHCAGYMNPELWRRCPRLTRRYLDDVGTLFFDPVTRLKLAEAEQGGPFTEQVHADFGRPMCEAGFAIRASCYLELGGFRPDHCQPDGAEPLLHERFPLMLGAALGGYRVTQLPRPWWSTSPRRLVGEPEVQFGPEFAQTEMKAHRAFDGQAYAALEQNADKLDLQDLRVNCVLDYIILPSVLRPPLARRHRAYFGEEWKHLIASIHRWYADSPEPEPRQLVDFACQLTQRHATSIIQRLERRPEPTPSAAVEPR